MTLMKKPFILLLLSQGISNLGDIFQLLAVTTLLMEKTGSGVAAGFTLICTPLSSIFLSPFAGVLSDRYAAKHMLILIDLLRGFLVIFFTHPWGIPGFYLLILLLSGFDILYSPARNKTLTQILDKKELVSAAAFQNGIFGTANVLAPFIAGAIIGIWGVNTAFRLNSLSFFLSALFILPIKIRNHIQKPKKKLFAVHVFKDLGESVGYCLKMPPILELLKIGFVICFCTASVNFAFYSFAFDTLGVSSRGWGLILSTMYGTNLIAMLLSFLLSKRTERHGMTLIYTLLCIVSAIWIGYSLLDRLGPVVLLQSGEGTSFALISILFNSFLLMKTKKEFVGRVSAVGDFLNNMGKLMSIAMAFLLLQISSNRFLFFMNAVLLFSFAAYKLKFRSN